MVTIGVEFGQRKGPSAICVATGCPRSVDGRKEYHFAVRALERLDVGTKYPALADRLAVIETGVTKMAPDEGISVYVNATGLGEPLVEIIDSRIASRVRPVYLTYGDRRLEDGSRIELGKAFLVSRLQMLFESSRIHLPSTTFHAEVLTKELLAYDIQIDEQANQRNGAFRVGTQDDLVTALGLSVHQEPVGPGIY